MCFTDDNDSNQKRKANFRKLIAASMFDSWVGSDGFQL